MKHIVKRYSFDKKLIATGELTIEEDGAATILTYTDPHISASAHDEQDPLLALENLRKQIESSNSIIAINGCRIDTAYVSTPTYGTYVIKDRKPSTRSIGLFEPTTEIEKLCTSKVHQAAYANWLESILTSNNRFVL